MVRDWLEVVARPTAGLGRLTFRVDQPLLAGARVGNSRQSLDLLRSESGETLRSDRARQMSTHHDLRFGNGSWPAAGHTPPLLPELSTPRFDPGFGSRVGLALEQRIEHGGPVSVWLVSTLVACLLGQTTLGTVGSGGWRRRCLLPAIQ
jgi:hypothetical protein